uniref:Uncharacterized protein n=1 Tax=Strigamia maritima TaxID=126957 RepID=T1J7F5_STRMM
MILAAYMVKNPFREGKGGESKKDYLKKMYEACGIFEASSNTQSSKERFLKKKYVDTKNWANQTGEGVRIDEGEKSFRDKVLGKCPWYFLFAEAFDQIQQYNPSYVNDSGTIISDKSDKNTEQPAEKLLESLMQPENENDDPEEYSSSNLNYTDDISPNTSQASSPALGQSTSTASSLALGQSTSTASSPALGQSTSASTTTSLAGVDEYNRSSPTFSESCAISKNKSVTNFSSALRKSLKRNSLNDTILLMEKSRNEERMKEKIDIQSTNQARLNLDTAKFEWEKEKWNKQVQHEERMAELRIKELELKLRLHQAENDNKT